MPDGTLADHAQVALARRGAISNGRRAIHALAEKRTARAHGDGTGSGRNFRDARNDGTRVPGLLW